MCAEDRASPIIASGSNNDKRSQKISWSYPEVVNYLMKNYATNLAVAEYAAANLRYMRPVSITSQQYADDSVAR